MSTTGLNAQTVTFEIAKGPKTNKTETVRTTIEEHPEYNRKITFLGVETRRRVEIGVEGQMSSPAAVPLSGDVPEWTVPLLQQLGIREIRR